MNIVITGGVHGNEIGGVLAAYCLKQVFPQIPNYSVLNPQAYIRGTRKFQGKDMNRQFGTNNVTANNILQKILSHRPKYVITLHEDDTIDDCYAYCSNDLRPIVEKCVAIMRNLLPGIPKNIHGDIAVNGVVTDKKYPPKGTLELEVEKYGIQYVCLETPELEKLSERIKALIHGASHFIKTINK